MPLDLDSPGGGPGDAIDFALDHLTNRFRSSFLEDWRAGDFRRFPEYLEWLEVQRAGRDANRPRRLRGFVMTAFSRRRRDG